MYICVCTAVTERDIARCVEAGASTFEQVQFETGLGTCCGQCSEYAREHIAQVCQGGCARQGDADTGHVPVRRLAPVPLARAA